MNIRTIKTHKIRKGDSIFRILDSYIKSLEEGSIVAVTSKIVSICEGRIMPYRSTDKDDLVKKEADYYLPKSSSKYNLFLTIKNNLMAVSAGIDESNSDGNYILWPVDPQKSANDIRSYLSKKFGRKKLGVVITDSITSPLKFGVTGVGIAHSGFLALNDIVGKADVFGRKLKMTKVSIIDGLAASAVLAMGEGGEQTPLAVITDVPFVKFQNRNPSKSELSALRIKLTDDVYAPVLEKADWKKGLK
jgi:putative folate metabolism gamma-glutamate ligase